MQNLETTTAEKLPTKKRKRRNSNHNKNNNHEDDGHNNSNNHNDIPTTTHHATLSPKKAAAAAEEKEEGGRPEKILTTRPGVDWKNLDFILSLQSKEINLRRKVELAFDFVNSDAHNRTCKNYNPQCESVQSSRLIPFLNDWIQSLLISPDKKIPIKGKDIDPCLDSRCWVVFKFCLEQSSSPLSFSPNLLRAVSRVIKDASSIKEQQLFGLVSDCFFLLFSSHGLSFNANVDVWASASAAALDLVHKIFTDSFNLSGCDVGVLLRLSYSVLEPFANFLRVHPSPKNVFPVVVDRLLEPLLTMLVLLDHSSNGSKGDSAGSFLKVGEDILLNGLFHSAHIDGFLCIRSSVKYVKSEVLIKGAKESKAVVKSYHKHLFHKLEQFVAEKKMLVLGGLGQLLLLFVSRVKKQKGTMSSVGTEATSKAGVLGRSESVDKQSTSEISVRKQSLVLEEALSSSRMDEATSNSVFDVFVQFMEPLVFDVKRSSGRWSKVGDCSESVLFGAQCTLKSVNKILSSFMHEKLYVRTEDTSEGAHHNFLKEVYDTVIAFSTEMHVHWLSALKKDDGRCTEMLLWIAKEVIVAVGYFLEIEYEVIGNDLVGLSHMMLSYLAIDLSLVDAQHVIQEVLHLGCQLVNVYSELRQERHARVAQIQLLDDAGLRVSRKGIKKWGKHILNSKQEAADLTSFITGYLPLMFTKKQSASVNGDSIGMGEATLGTCEDDAWDFGVSSVNEKSLPTAIWWLLCQNTDVWCPHATKKNLKKFLSLLFYHCLSSVSSFGSRGEPNKEEPGCLRKVTPHYISLELLGDTALYEETFLCRNLTSRFCRILKKSFSPLFFLSSSSDVDFNSLPDWSEVLSMLEKASAVGSTNDTQPHSDGCLMMELDPLPPNLLTLEITACQSLLNILCWMPQGYTNSQSFVVYATYILNIERLVVTSLLSCQGELFAGSHYEFFKLFVSCRRALRYLAMASDEGKLEDRQSSLTEILFGSTFSALWLLKSVSEVVGLLHSFSGEEHCRQVKDMIFSLMDHTSNIFLTLNECQMNVAIQSQAYKQSLSEELPIQNQGNEQDNVIAADLDSNSSECFNAWKCLELVAETLKEQARSLLDTKFIGGINASNWNKLSSLISCFQGFLWGIASALNEVDEAKGHSPKWSLGNVSEFILCINVFEDFVNVCLNTLLVDESSASESLCASCRLPDIDYMNKALSLQVTSRTTVKSSGGEDEISPGKQPDMGMADRMDDHSASDAENENATNSGIKFTRTFSSKKQRLKSVLTKCAVNVLSEAHKIDLFELQHLNRPFLRILLKGEHPEVAFSLGQLFTTSSAILRLKHLISSPKVLKLQIDCNKCVSTSMVILIGTSHFVLSEFAEMVGRPHPFSLVWLGGIIKYLEVLGSYFPLTNPVLTRNVYSKLIDVHLRAIGRCISLQGKSATLASHEIESSTKTLQAQEGSSDNCAPSLGHRHYSINEFKARLRLSFKMFIRKPLELHLLSAVQALERALVGAQESCNMMYGIHTGGIDGGEVSSMVAAGIDCLDLVLESVSGHRRLNIVKRHIQSLISALFNIVLHLQSPLIFSQGELNHNKGETNPDSGSVVLMCVEVLTKVAGRNSLFQMAPYHVGQALHLPTTLFRHFCQLTASPDRSHSMVFNAEEEVRHVTGMHLNIVDRQFSIDLYAACCKLLYTILRHQKSESERCIALLEDSVRILLYCLEAVDAGFVSKKGYFVWQLQEGIKCASFLRRIYEEIRQQKDILGRYSFHFLSNYISTYSGYGPLKTGIRREIDEALRPGLYALIDSCSPDDLQQLHVVLGEGPCRGTLATLQHDYKLNFQYQGKV